MSSTKNLAQMFAQSAQEAQQAPQGQQLRGTRSQAVDATDDSHFENTTFQLKRTRSVGLLDEFIAPTRKLIEEQERERELQSHQKNSRNTASGMGSGNLHFQSSSDEGEFIEDVDERPHTTSDDPTTSTNKNIIHYENDENDYDDHDHNDENLPASPSMPDSGDVYQPHDDNDIVYEPSRHVDYLSHNWKESDISKSWRYIVLKRKDVANSARLENASWRTWAQAKYHLKTVSPESVNWLKDSDVTWLYGPIYKEAGKDDLVDADKKYGSDGESSNINAIKREKKKKQQKRKGPKPILKKRTVSEMLTQPSRIVLPHHHHHQQHHQGRKSPTDVNTPSPPAFEDDFDLISQRVNAQYSKPNPLSQSSNATELNSTTTAVVGQEPAVSPDEPVKRHIHFNDRVQQCISVNPPDPSEVAREDHDNEEYDNEDEHGDDEQNDEADDSESDDEGGFFLSVRSPSSAQIHGFMGMSGTGEPEKPNESSTGLDDDASSLKLSGKPYQTIAPLPATTLNYGSDSGEESNDEEQFVVSHRTNTGRGYNYLYDYNSVYQGNPDHDLVHIGNNDYEVEDTPQPLEGVSMVDVPEDIVLGSNVETVDAPQSLLQGIIQPATAQDPLLSRQRSGFSLQNSDSDSDESEEMEGVPLPVSVTKINSCNSINNHSQNITMACTSPSFASLSDVAAHGFIQSSNSSNLSSVFRKSQTDLNELQKDFSNLSSSTETDAKLKTAILNSWKKN